MVVPIFNENDANRASEIKKYVGNNLQLKFIHNTCTIIVIGNNSSIEVSENFGVVKVVGNNCAVDISKCHGLVEYTGNNGKISIGGNMNSDMVTYNGNNGRIVNKNQNSDKNKSENCIPTATKLANERQHTGLENLGSLNRSEIINRSIYVKDNAKIVNPRIKTKTFDLNSFFYSGLFAQ